MGHDSETNEAQARRARDIRLVVFAADSVSTFPLELNRTLTIGRGKDTDICVDEPGLSRRHATIGVTGEEGAELILSVRDLGSRNGVVANGRKLEKNVEHAFQPGEFLELGDVSIVVQCGAPELREASDGGLDGLCLASDRSHRPLALLSVRISGCDDERTIRLALSAFVRRGDLITANGAREWELALAETTVEQAEQAAAGIKFALGRAGASAQIGVAEYPSDGHDPSTLRAAARTRCAFAPRANAEPAATGPAGSVIADGDMQKLYRTVERIAASELSVLILGETGVGKEVVARTIHVRSKRANQPFLALNCAAFAETILESELFGHEKGAFTGATSQKPGLLEQADGGTIFLDELGEMPRQTQTKLLRVIEHRCIRRLGSVEDRRIDVRFIAATNRELAKEMSEGRFREDLYYRLNGFSIVVPPLRERPSEIDALARSFAAKAWAREGRTDEPMLSEPVLRALRGHRWPGNVRELKNVIERAVVLAGEKEITPSHLPEGVSSDGERDGSLYSEVERFERDRIVSTLAAFDGNQTKTAAKLGLSRKALMIRLDRYGIERPRKG